MRYSICNLCGDVTEGLGSNSSSKMYDHLHEKHSDIVKEIREDQERYSKEINEIKEPLSYGSFWMTEDFSKKDGRKEYEGKIMKFHGTPPES